MKKTHLVLLTAVLILGTAPPFLAQDTASEEPPTGKNYPVNLSLYYPISLNRSEHDSVNLNLSLIYARVGYVHGLDLSLIGSAVTHRLEGLQLCGLAAVVGGSGRGGQVAGLACVIGDGFSGFQLAGLANVSGERLSGLQVSGLANVIGEQGTALQVSGLFNVVGDRGSVGQVSGIANVAGEGFSGFQVSAGFNVGGGPSRGLQVVGLFNVVGERYDGMQVAGLFNVVGERCEGAQVSALFNVAGEEMRGFQAGSVNIAVHQRGLQLGLANVGEDNTGVQLGLVNYTKGNNTGVPIGAVNIARNGRIGGRVWGGNAVALSGGVKFSIARFYSILSLGAFNLEDGIAQSLTYGFHYGLTFPLSRMTLNADAGYRFRDNSPLFRNPADRPDQHILEGRLSLGVPLSDGITLVVGTGIGHGFDAGSALKTGNTYPLLTAGLEFF